MLNRSFIKLRPTGRLAACALLVPLSCPAAAQESDFFRRSEWNLTMGGGPLVTPNYEGSKHYVIRPLPMFEASWRDTVSLSAVDGTRITIRPLADHGLFFATGLGYWSGRKEGVDKYHGDTLRGLGNLSGGAVGSLEAGYRIEAASVGLRIARDLGNDRDGTTLTLKGGYRIFQSRDFKLSGDVSATWADDNYMNSLFGITPAQARGSLKHYAPFKAEAGIKDVKLALKATYSLTPSTSVFAMAGMAYLLGDAADSPIVRTQGSREQITGAMGLTYRF